MKLKEEFKFKKLKVSAIAKLGLNLLCIFRQNMIIDMLHLTLGIKLSIIYLKLMLKLQDKNYLYIIEIS
jgi:hypothetical protein